MSVFVPALAKAAPLGEKAGPVGPGAGPLMTEFILPSVLKTDPRQKMSQAVMIGMDVAYIRLAEAVISGKIGDPLAGIPWRIEDPDGETVDDDYAGDPRAKEAYDLIERPMAALDPKEVGTIRSRADIWEITSRHMGLAGQGAWFLDSRNDFDIPTSIVYVRPDRLKPEMDGLRLEGWRLDQRPGFDGVPLDVEDIMLISLQTPDEGIWTVGLIESALTKGLLNGSIDKHFAMVLAGGGRLSGILSPKADPIESDVTYGQLVRDWRNVTEQPESARRLQVVRAPIEFTRTVATMDELKLIDLMGRNRDDLLAIWRVPLSQIGGQSPTGLNSGEVRKYDYQALIENAVTPRLSRFQGALQNLLDRFDAYLGFHLRIVFDLPSFDDDSPRYDKIQKAQFIAMSNNERRDMLGWDPIPPEMMGPTGQPLGDEVWMPNTLSPLGIAPTAEPTVVGQGLQAPAWSAYKPTPPPAPAAGAPQEGGQKAKTVKGADVIPAVLAALKKQWPASELDIVRQGKWTFDPAFPVKKINAARRPIARNPKIVAGAEAVIAIGAPISPVTLIHTKRIGKPGYEPIDGWHRTAAAIKQGLKTIPAYVGEGDDAWTKALIAFDDDIPTPPDSANDEEPSADKAAMLDRYQAAMKFLRASTDVRVTPTLRSKVAAFLAEQKSAIVAQVRDRYEAIKRKPGDRQTWFGRADRWDASLSDVLASELVPVAHAIDRTVTERLRPPQKADTGALGTADRGAVIAVLRRGATKVRGINQTTEDALAEIIAQGIEDGMGPAELGDAVEAWSGWDEYRAELIARTELTAAYNAAALGSYGDAGVTQVQAVDGTDDPECLERNGQVYPIDEADTIEDHPNGTLDWLPVVDYESLAADFGAALGG